MPERTPYIAANWKMHKTVAEAAEFVDALLPRIAATQSDVVLCPPYTALAEVVERSRGSAVRVAAQNMHEEESGGFTGEVSAPMLVELDVEAVVLGHSERRQYFNETDAALARKVPAALAAGLEPILCVGESEDARDFIRDVMRMRGATADRVRVLYGGSVKPDNAAELLSLPDVDGALVGGASLDPADFAAIVEAAG
jgi:triosephosphate isomerase